MNKLKVSEIFESIQGEGRYQGYPAIFVRLSGCTRDCSFCDSKYHKKGISKDIKDIINYINKSKLNIVVWTGGEPLLQFDLIRNVIENTIEEEHHLESNGDLILNLDSLADVINWFNYICFSPKNVKVAKRLNKLINQQYLYQSPPIDIKVVTDLEKVGVVMLKYATMLMPLTTYNEKKDLEIKRKVWNYCTKHNLFYSARLHIEVWKEKRKK